MKVIDKTIRELHDLDPDEALNVLNFVLTLKEKPKAQHKKRPQSDAYRNVRKALKNCSGTLSSDIIAGREEQL